MQNMSFSFQRSLPAVWVFAILLAATPLFSLENVKTDSTSSDELFEGGEESLFSEEPVQKPQTRKPDSLERIGTPEPGTAAGSTVLPLTDTAIGAGEQPQTPVAAPSQAVSNAVSVPAKVEDVRAVNFAGSLKDYRSPKLAMLLSLLLPGAGQAYAGNYTKTAIFAVIEAGIIGVSVAYNVKGKNETQKANNYADSHFKGERFNAYYDSLKQFFRDFYVSRGDSTNPDSMAWLRMNDIFYPTEGDTFINTFMQQVASRSSDYYDAISYNSYVQGWDDCEPDFRDILSQQASGIITVERSGGGFDTFTVHSAADTGYLVARGSVAPGGTSDLQPLYGYSENQITYANWVTSANGYYRTGLNVLYLLLVNHIGSAIDAGITAKKHNDRLLGKQSFWNRIDLDPICLNTGSQLSAGYAVRVKF